MYQLTGVTKTYNKGRDTVEALRGVDLTIEDGRWLAIQGPPGTARARCCRYSAASTGPPQAAPCSTGKDLGGTAGAAASPRSGPPRSGSSSRRST